MSNSTTSMKQFLKGRFSQLAILAIFVVLLIGAFMASQEKEVLVETAPAKPIVTLMSADQFSGLESLSLIGTVRPLKEANITSEISGRLTSVNVVLGQYVGAGAVIATLENASERASVLQAEGVYESALASANQSGLAVPESQTGLESAKKNAIATMRSSYNTANGVIVSNVDKFFSQPNSPLPGLRISGKGYTTDLNKERVAYQALLPEWKERTDALTIESNLDAELDYSKQNIQRTVDLIDTFLFIFNQNRDDENDADEANFNNLRASLLSTLSSLDNARSGITSANDAIVRSTATASGGDASSAEAQVKQALGALRSAEANLDKTVLRSPISGAINSLNIKTGDFLNAFTPVAVVANNSALEIITFVSETERSLLKVGDIVLIDDKHEARVAQFSPVVDPSTKKIEVRLATESADIIAGNTVRITKEIVKVDNQIKTVQVPLSAVRLEAVDGFVFVIEDNRLVARPVVLGMARGGSIEIVSGISASDLFVKDARGLVAGTEVEVKS